MSVGTYYTPQEEKELNAQLKKWQNKAKRLILNKYYDSAAEYLSEDDFFILQKITNAQSYKDINTYLWNSGIIEYVLDKVKEKLKKVQKEVQKKCV